jgi:acyl-CoA thioesterase-1
MNRILAIFLACAACAAAPFETVPGSKAVTPQTPAVVFLGDSLTAGQGVPADELYPALIARRVREEGLPFSVVNAGLGGDTTDGGLRRLDGILQQPVSIVFVALGANDGFRHRAVDDIRRNLAAIIERSRAADKQVVLAGMKLPLWLEPQYRASFERMYPALAAEEQVPLVPFLLEGVGGIPAMNQADGIHPNAAGQRVMAGVVWPVLAPVLRDAARR